MPMYKKLLTSILILTAALQQNIYANTLQSAYGWHNAPSHQLVLRFKEAVTYTQAMYHATNTLELQFENTTISELSVCSIASSLAPLKQAGCITAHYYKENEGGCSLGLTFAANRNLTANQLVIGIRPEKNLVIIDVLPHDFFASNDPQAKKPAAPKNNASWRIMIDPGHGGKDPGAIASDKTYEKTLALDIAQRVTNKLNAKKFTTIMTRSDDTFIPLSKRSALASSNNADLFVSIHLNATRWPLLLSKGIESYSLRTPALLPSGFMRDYNFINQEHDPKRIAIAEQALKTTLETSKKLTAHIQHNLCTATTTDTYIPNNRGAKTETFRVLLLNSMPSTLIEAGFISNSTELEVLQQPEHRNRIAEGITRGIEQYIIEQTRKKRDNPEQ